MQTTMEERFGKIKKILFFIIGFVVMLGTANPVQGADFLTEDEKAYIVNRPVLTAASISGAGPITFIDSKGEAQGIGKAVLDEISAKTGLTFVYTLYNSLEELLASNADIIYAIPPNYAPENMNLSQPFLKSETILYINSSLESENLDDKIYAAVEGSQLPEGIKEENSIYFSTREESLETLNKGHADYGYGNAYSVMYYSIKNDYKDLVTIPKGKEFREYCIGLLNKDDILLSILNKSKTPLIVQKCNL